MRGWSPLLLGLSTAAAAAGAAFVYLSPVDRLTRPVPPADDPQPPPGRTGYRLIDQMLPRLRALSESSGIPLGLLIGWIARESGGRLSEAPKPLKGEPDSERGYFQLTPSESRSLSLDHARLSTDPDYSLQAGIALIRRYQGLVDKLNVAPPGSAYYWKLVKLAHTMGSGALDRIAKGAAAAGRAGSWEALTQWAYDNNAALTALLHHAPSKWLPHVDKLYAIGYPFGFGAGATPPSASAQVGWLSDLELLDAEILGCP